jgi:hypothetical protein
MASLDDVDRIDLHIAKMFDRALGPPRAFSERSRRIEPLGVILDRSRLRWRQRKGFAAQEPTPNSSRARSREAGTRAGQYLRRESPTRKIMGIPRSPRPTRHPPE